MSQPSQQSKITREQIGEIYDQGKEAVITFVEELLGQITKLENRLSELEGRINKDSHNSSKPPSSDGFGKRTKSLRQKSEKPSGGQAGHPGKTLEWSSEPDLVKVHPVDVCSTCGESLSAVPVEELLSRQVHDIPPIEILVTEHQIEVKSCPCCGTLNQGEFPAEASNVIQYGPRLKAMMVYLMDGQLLPSERSCELLKDMMGVSLSEGTLYNSREQCFEVLEPIEQEIVQAYLYMGFKPRYMGSKSRIQRCICQT